MRAFFATREARHVSLLQDPLALVRSERWPAAQDDDPLLVRVVRVVRPEAVAGLELVHAAADQLRAALGADPRVLSPPARPVPGAGPLLALEVEGLHGEEGNALPEGSRASAPLVC